ncbi:MAG TPA: hypothetical protein VN829_09400 [Dongiaceae bacterium]|nr:hypothetical protein [Dongiaceae bacterium]
MNTKEQLDFIHDMQRQVSGLMLMANVSVVLGFVAISLCWLAWKRRNK